MQNENLDNEFNLLSPEEIAETNDLQKALELINKEHVISDPDEIKPLKKFVVEKNDKLSEIINSSDNDEEKTNAELDEVANQADQAFYDVMDMIVSAGIASKGLADMANAAQSFLDIKLKSRIAKTDIKFKKLKHELDEKKYEASIKIDTPTDITSNDDDGIIVINN